jgi:hypothetical protein
MKSISLKETKKALLKALEIQGNEYSVAETLNEETGIRVDFKFNMRSVISNPTFFKHAAAVMEKYDAILSLEPKEPKGDGLWIELSVSMKVSEIKP